MNVKNEQELSKLQKSPPENIEISIPDESNLHHWELSMKGPISTPYEGGKFALSLTFPENYPFKPPTILFKTKIYHPNINTETGEICAAVLYDEWGPTLNVMTCLGVLEGLLKHPNADSPLEEKIASQFRENKVDFETTAKKWTEQYAK